MATGHLAVGITGASLGTTFGRVFQSVDTRVKRLGNTVEKTQFGHKITGQVVRLQRRLQVLRRRQRSTGDSYGKLELR